MKEYSRLILTVEREKYAKYGVHKGMDGWICDPRNINGQWLVSFDQYGALPEIACIPVKEEDLEVLFEPLIMQIGSKVLLFESVYKRLGLQRGLKGIIIRQGERADQWVVRFEKQEGLYQAVEISLDANDMALDPDFYN